MTKAPTYVYLLAEYVGRLEVLVTYDRIPPEVKKSMLERAKELKALGVDDLHIEELVKDLRALKEHQTKTNQNESSLDDSGSPEA